MLLSNLTSHYIFFGISIYFSYFRLQLLQSPQHKLLKKFSGAHCLVPRAARGNPEPVLGSSAMWGWTKRKILYLLPVLNLTDPMAACSPPAQQPGLALRWAGGIQCCGANYYGILMDLGVYQSFLPPDLKHPWERARNCRNFGGFESFWV